MSINLADENVPSQRPDVVEAIRRVVGLGALAPTETGAFTVDAGHAYSTVPFDSPAPAIVTLPSVVAPGFWFRLVQIGDGAAVFRVDDATDPENIDGHTWSGGRGAVVLALFLAGSWFLSGATAPAGEEPEPEHGAFGVLASAYERPVTLNLIGPSHMLFAAYGYDRAFGKAAASRCNIYASAVYNGAGGNNGYLMSCGAPPGAVSTGLPAEFEPFVTGNGYTYADGTQGGGSGSNGIQMSTGHDLGESTALRSHWWIGSWPSGGGNYRPAIQTLGGAGVITAPLQDSNKGSYGVTDFTLDAPAADRSGLGMRFPFVYASGGVTQWPSSPQVAIACCVERPDRLAGLQVQTIYAHSGYSLKQYYDEIVARGDVIWENLFQKQAALQVARGFTPKFVFVIEAGSNDLDATALSAGPNPAPGNTGLGYVDGLVAIESYFLARLNAIGLPSSAGHFISMVSARWRDGTGDEVFDDIADKVRTVYVPANPTRRSYVAFCDEFTSEELIAVGAYVDDVHHANSGYDLLTERAWSKVDEVGIGPVWTALPTIDGVILAGQDITVTPAVVKDEANVTRAYRWFLGGEEVDGETGTTLPISPEDAGLDVQCFEDLTKSGITITLESNILQDTTILAADYENGAYFFNGTSYADEAALNVARGYTKVGNTRYTTTPVLGAEMYVNDASAYAVQTDVTVANGGGGVEVTRPADPPSINYAYQTFPGIAAGDAFAYSYTITTVSGSPLYSRFGAAAGGSTYRSFTSAGAKSGIIGISTPFLVLSLGDGVATNNGVGRITDATVKKAKPHLGFTGNAFSKGIDFTLPGSQSVDEVIWQMDIGNETPNIYRLRLARLVADGHLHLIATLLSATVADLDLGATVLGTRHVFAGAFATNDFAASLDGAACVTDTSGNLPSYCYEWIGRSFAGDTFTGTIHSEQTLNGRMSNAWLETVAGA